MTHDEKIAVIREHRDGKQIQSQYGKCGKWRLTTDPSWNFASYNYRVKPEPEEFDICVNKRDGRIEEWKGGFVNDGWRRVRVRVVEQPE